MNRVASSSSVDEARPAIHGYLKQLINALQFPPYVWVGMVLLAAVGLCYSLTIHTKAELQMATMEHSQLAAQVKRLEIDNARLARELVAVEKDPRTIETLARQAGMIANGESVVLLDESATKKTTQETQSRDK